MKKEEFEELYNRTYKIILKYIAIRCENIEDINDIIQDTYIELYKILQRKKEIKIENEMAFITGIAKNKIKKYVSLKYRIQKFTKVIEDEENIIEDIDKKMDIEQQFIDKENVSEVWRYLRKKNLITYKIFYLYFGLGIKIGEISEKLDMKESTVKNHIYRTLKQLRSDLERKKKDDK